MLQPVVCGGDTATSQQLQPALLHDPHLPSQRTVPCRKPPSQPCLTGTPGYVSGPCHSYVTVNVLEDDLLRSGEHSWQMRALVWF